MGPLQGNGHISLRTGSSLISGEMFRLKPAKRARRMGRGGKANDAGQWGKKKTEFTSFKELISFISPTALCEVPM